MSYGILGCPEQDSNLHASQHSHLKRARLPFRHLGLFYYFISPLLPADASLDTSLSKVAPGLPSPATGLGRCGRGERIRTFDPLLPKQVR